MVRASDDILLGKSFGEHYSLIGIRIIYGEGRLDIKLNKGDTKSVTFMMSPCVFSGDVLGGKCLPHRTLGGATLLLKYRAGGTFPPLKNKNGTRILRATFEAMGESGDKLYSLRGYLLCGY